MGFPVNTQSDYSKEYFSVKATARISGYNQQYLRRLLGRNVFRSKQLGQICRLNLLSRTHLCRYKAWKIQRETHYHIPRWDKLFQDLVANRDSSLISIRYI